MSNMARTDEIDEVVSSVRDFVSHKGPHKTQTVDLVERLVLTPEQLVKDEITAQPLVVVDVIAASTESNVLRLDTAKREDLAGLEATIAELEAAVTAQSDDWEPDEGESFEQSAWAVSAFQMPDDDSDGPAEIEGDHEVSVSDETEHQPPEPEMVETPVDEQDLAEADLSEPDILGAELAAVVSSAIDKEALRALVVEIVHDELSGELGERITRNVRKLVRREINYVLTSREMDQN